MDTVLVHEAVANVAPTRPHTATVIFLHGLGQYNLTWRLVMAEAFGPLLPHVKWLLPQAPLRPVTINPGQRRPSWFDVARLPPGDNEYDESAISESVSLVENLILSEVHGGIDPRRIVMMGFSQGAALALMTSLTTLHELGGVVSLSGWIPRRARDNMLHTAPNLPILWCHGRRDDQIPIRYAEDALSFMHHVLRVPRSKISYKSYEGLSHNINDEELSDIASWLQALLR